jgi:hypothetical protein
MDERDELRSLIDQVRRRWRRRAMVRTLAVSTAGVAVVLFAGALIDYLRRPQGTALVALGAGSACAALAVAVAAIRRMPARPSDRRIARFVEEQTAALIGSELHDSLASAIDAAERPDNPAGAAFLPLLLRDAIARLQAVPPEQILPAASWHRAMLGAAAAAGLLLLALVASAPFLERAGGTAWVAVFPRSIHIEVIPGNVRVPAGSAVRIRASLRGPTVAAGISPELRLAVNDSHRTVPMARAGDGFEFTVSAVDRTFSYAVAAGAAESPRFTVTALAPPRVERIDLHFEYPDFAGLPPRDQEDAGDIYAPAGTRVRLRIHTDKAIARGALALTRAGAVSLRAADARTLEGELTLAANDSYRVRLADTDGLDSASETEYFIRLMDDRPPDVRILRPAGDQQITPLEEVPIEARADDDYGVSTFELVYSVGGSAERVVPFERISGTNVQKIGTRLLAAEEFGVKPGDVITYYARARDVARGKRSTEATSDIFFLEVKPFNAEFVAAQSQGAGAGSDPQLESLIQAQKEIISSTWNVERRSGNGRSADDVKAIADAQSELRSRAERQLVSRAMRLPGQPPAPQRQIPADTPGTRTGGDPAAAALEAMGRAQDQLQTARTKEALTHEMAALNGLLQVQAEIRRRQVSQQANGAGGTGSNRAEQDLSALFDKELQRQQRTNYETRPSVETAPDRAESDGAAMDRIRDLARRQEDLSRRQAELANANLSAEEVKRRLERLTREQSQLREEAEQLLRRQGEANASSRGRSGQRPDEAGARTQGQERLRDAVDQMRSAASELRRDDPGKAAASAQRAAEQLRQLGDQAAAGARGGESTGDAVSPEARQLSDKLDQARQIRERVQRAEQQLRSAEKQARGTASDGSRERQGASADRGSGTARGSDQAQAMDDGPSRPAGRTNGAEGAQANSPRGASGREPGRGAGQGSGGNAGEVQRLRDEYRRELQRAQQALERLSAGEPRAGANGATPEEQQFSHSAPGTEAFKQDRSSWESLRKDLDSALEQYEASVSDRLARTRPGDRLNAGGSERVPDAYRQLIARYFESLAKKKS